jgi:hypothetical protein
LSVEFVRWRNYLATIGRKERESNKKEGASLLGLAGKSEFSQHLVQGEKISMLLQGTVRWCEGKEILKWVREIVSN